jgi:membrane protein required for colicin V production
MNFIDIVLIIPLVYAAWKGLRKGFVIEVFTFLAFFVGIYAGVHFSEFASEKLSERFDFNNDYLPAVSFTVTFLAVGAIVFFAGKAIEKVVKVTALSPMNKMSGLVFGALKMLLILSVLLSIVESYSEKNDLISQEERDNSILYKPIKAVGLYTVPGLRTSSMFIENALKPASDSTGMTVRQVFRAKEIADSLGIEPKDVIELHEIYLKHQQID